jgi:hypothetical protein
MENGAGVEVLADGPRRLCALLHAPAARSVSSLLFFLAKFRAARGAVLAVAIGADQAVTEFHGAELAADVAHEGFVGARGGGWFNGLLSHELQSMIS